MTPDLIVVHCSASGWGTLEVIDGWHRDRGFRRSRNAQPRHVGYHYVIENGHARSGARYNVARDGAIRPARDEDEQGAHARGVNAHSLGVCLVGRDDFSERQLAALLLLLASLCVRYGLAADAVIGHRETDHEQASDSPKTCPQLDCDDLRARLAELLASLAQITGNGASDDG